MLQIYEIPNLIAFMIFMIIIQLNKIQTKLINKFRIKLPVKNLRIMKINLLLFHMTDTANA